MDPIEVVGCEVSGAELALGRSLALAPSPFLCSASRGGSVCFLFFRKGKLPFSSYF